MENVRVGILGFGRIGGEHAQWLSGAGGIRAVAAADLTSARRDLAVRRGLRIFKSIDEMLADKDIDVVLISTPTAMHFGHAMSAISAGKHLMIEKPMVMSLEEGTRMLAHAKNRKCVVSVFQNRRWDNDYLTMEGAVEAGVFGDIINVESRLGQWASCVGAAAKEYRPNWRNEAAFGGGALFDWGSHFVDQMWRLMRPARPLRVFAQLRGNVWSRDCDDFARVLIDFDSGATGMVEINTTTRKPGPRWHIDGTAGSAESPASENFDVEQWAKISFAAADNSPERLLERPNKGMNEVGIWEQFGRAVRGEGKPAVSAESVLITTALLDAARESSRLGIAIELASGKWELYS